MSVLTRLNVGLVGAAGRGGSFRTAFETNGARIHAVCDLHEETLEGKRTFQLCATVGFTRARHLDTPPLKKQPSNQN